MNGTGKGLAKGLAVTLKTMTRRSTTRQYPDVAPDLPPRSRGVIALFEENCTVCMLCARECPDWCIYIDSHKEEVVVPGAARARAVGAGPAAGAAGGGGSGAGRGWRGPRAGAARAAG